MVREKLGGLQMSKILPNWLEKELTKLGLKYCNRCNEIRPFAEFPISRQKGTGLRSACKVCTNVYNRKNWWETYGPEQKRLYKIRHKYQLSEEQAKFFADNPEGFCAICGTYGLMVIDHDHETGNFRDRLCRNCNTALGMVNDNVELMEKLIAYVTKHRIHRA